MWWRNSDFQIANFIAGKCHTADEAYRQLLQLKEERVLALRTADASAKRKAAKVLKAKHTLNTATTEWEKLEAEADLMEATAFAEQELGCYKAALHEVEFIDACIEKILPHRKFAHLDDHMAAQACQQEEWKAELVERAKDYLLTTGTIPHDHYRTMRLHPEYQEEIAPKISEITYLVRSGKSSLVDPDRVLSSGENSIQKLLLEDNNNGK